MSENNIKSYNIIENSFRKSFVDSVDPNRISPSPIQGFVETRLIDKDGNVSDVVEGRDNLIVYRGRSYTLSRMFNKPIHDDGPGGTLTNMHQKYVAWFGVGHGGAANFGYTPNIVNPTDSDLIKPGDVSIADTEQKQYVTTVGGRTYCKFDSGYPEYNIEDELWNNEEIKTKLLTDSSHLFNNGSENVSSDAHLVAKINITLFAGDANGTTNEMLEYGLQDGQQFINELGLFMAPDTI